MNFNELINDMSDPPPAIVDGGILLDKTLCLVLGQPKSGKTLFATNLALKISFGEDYLGFKINNPKKVLYLSAEGGYYPNRNRIKLMGAPLQQIQNASILGQNFDFNTYSNYDLSDDKSIKEIISIIKKHEVEVLIIDPLVRFHSGDENSAKDISVVMKNIRSLIEDYNLSIIIVHHSGKQVGRGARGSSVITSEYDSRITITKQQNYSILSFDMRHVETPEKMKVKLNTDSLWFEMPNSLIPQELIPGAELEKSNILKHIQGLGFSQSNAYTKFDGLKNSGIIEEIPGKKVKLIDEK